MLLALLFALLVIGTDTAEPHCCVCRSLDEPVYYVNSGISGISCDNACQLRKTCPGICATSKYGECKPVCTRACPLANGHWVYQNCHIDSQGNCTGMVSCFAPVSKNIGVLEGFCSAELIHPNLRGDDQIERIGQKRGTEKERSEM
eukprot:TRINITY_DN1054_c0_g1_i1.p1 TRINITY_DN1054_c0_g1~~TRINITY_DN1054_c0_g1_i1.p1  ORF type:complete len:146 (-),score=10.54 TRINITY_DN1054_c0_g1_i1:242-679(-)